MTRALMRLLLATFVAIALVVGFSSGPSSAAPVGATSSTDSAAEQRADVTTPSEDCQAEYDVFIASATAYNTKTKQVQRDNRQVKRQQGKLAQAKNAKQERKAQRKLAKAKRAQSTHAAEQRALKQEATTDYVAWQDCEEAAGEPTDPETPTSPIQVLCDNGLPQEVCDAFSSIPLPTPGTPGTSDSPIQAACDAGLPQVLCDAAKLPGTDGASPLQPLCDLGLPAALCEASSGDPLSPLDPILEPVCGLLPLPGLCP